MSQPPTGRPSKGFFFKFKFQIKNKIQGGGASSFLFAFLLPTSSFTFSQLKNYPNFFFARIYQNIDFSPILKISSHVFCVILRDIWSNFLSTGLKSEGQKSPIFIYMKYFLIIRYIIEGQNCPIFSILFTKWTHERD